MQNLFGGRQKRQKKTDENIPKINLKGEQTFSSSQNEGGFYPEVSEGALERQLYGIEKGPRALPRMKRAKVWMALSAIGFWFFSCFSLVAYRLRSDDLELMEREVYQELKVKKEVERFQQKQIQTDSLLSDIPNSINKDELGLGKPIGETALPRR